MKRLQNRLGFNEIDLPDEHKPPVAPEPEEMLERWPSRVPSEQVTEAATLAKVPSLVDTVPMPNIDTDGDGDAATSRPDGDEPDATTAIPVRRQQDPEVT